MALVADALDDLPASPRSRSALPLSVLLHGLLIAAALWFMHPQPHDDPADLESVAVDIINVQTASDGDVVTHSDATQSMVAAGATPVTAEPVAAVSDAVASAVVPESALPPLEAVDEITAVQVPIAMPEAASIMRAAVPDSVEPAPVPVAAVQSTPVETTVLIEPAAQDTVEPEAQRGTEPARQADPRPKPKKPSPKKPSATGGSGGRSEANAQASAAPRGGSGQVAAGGSGAQSRYPGLVQARLKRALRAPPGNQRGQAYVSFLVNADGSVSNIHVVTGTGSAALDDAAVATVRRASPFPPIPADANRSSWSFTLPLRFR